MYKGVGGLLCYIISFFKYPMKMKQFGLTETKLFHFHRIFKKQGRGGGSSKPSCIISLKCMEYFLRDDSVHRA